MSASREKKTRQDQAGSALNDAKTAREAQQRREEHRTNVLYAVIGVVFVLVAIAAVIWKSNIIPKTATAATVNGEKYTAAEVNFYYQNYYQSFVNQYYSIFSMIGLDISAPLDEQTISETTVSTLSALAGIEATAGETWADFFRNHALDQVASIQALNEAAEADGFVYDNLEEDLAAQMESLSTTASSSGYSEQQYLNLVFGSTMSKSIYEEQTRRSLIATAYLSNYQEGLSYTTEELEAAYEENRSTFDLVDCAYVRVNGDAPDTDEEGNEIEVTEEMETEAMETAKATADAIYAAFEDGASLEDAAAEYDDTAVYTASESYANNTTVVGEWMYDEARMPGDSAVLEDSTNNAYYVVLFNDRGRNDYETVDVRHILIQPEATTLSEDDEGYEADVEVKNDAAEAEAQDILAEWEAGEATEDSFAALANEYSDDPGSNTTGGLYEQVYKGEMVAEFNDWCFDPARQPGDTGIIHNDSTGYHIMYFVGYNRPYWELQVESLLINQDTDEWFLEKTESYTAEPASFGMRFVG